MYSVWSSHSVKQRWLIVEILLRLFQIIAFEKRQACIAEEASTGVFIESSACYFTDWFKKTWQMNWKTSTFSSFSINQLRMIDGIACVTLSPSDCCQVVPHRYNYCHWLIEGVGKELKPQLPGGAAMESSGILSEQNDRYCCVTSHLGILPSTFLPHCWWHHLLPHSAAIICNCTGKQLFSATLRLRTKDEKDWRWEDGH